MVLIAGALLLGWHLNALTSTQLMRAGAAIAVLELLLIVPFRLWKSNKAEIERLNLEDWETAEDAPFTDVTQFVQLVPGRFKVHTPVERDHGRTG